MEKSKNAIWFVLFLVLVQGAIELAVSIYSQNISLRLDAGHMFLDAVNLAVLLWMFVYAFRLDEAVIKKRESVVSLISAAVLIVFLLFTVISMTVVKMKTTHALSVYSHPEAVIVSVVGLIINIIVHFVLKQHDHHHGIKVLVLHNVADFVMSVIAAISTTLTYWTGNQYWDLFLGWIFILIFIAVPVRELIVNSCQVLNLRISNIFNIFKS